MGGPWRPDALSLSERVALTRANEAECRGQRSRGPLPSHVWIDGRPGLLLGWRRADDGWWWGRVVLVEGEGAELAWVRQERLRPATGA